MPVLAQEGRHRPTLTHSSASDGQRGTAQRRACPKGMVAIPKGAAPAQHTSTPVHQEQADEAKPSPRGWRSDQLSLESDFCSAVWFRQGGDGLRGSLPPHHPLFTLYRSPCPTGGRGTAWTPVAALKATTTQPWPRNSSGKPGNSPGSEGWLTRHMKSSSVAVMAG